MPNEMKNNNYQRSAKLTIDTSPRSRKYRGEAGDLHFVPKSPLIIRQNLSLWQEEELLKACTKILERVPHSDESAVPEFKHLASHIVVDFPDVPNRKHDRHRSERTVNTQQTNTVTIPIKRPHTRTGPVIGLYDDTATPSTVSKHDIDDRTNATTPLTSTEASPHDILQQFPEKMPRLPVSQFCDLSRCQRNARTAVQVQPITVKSDKRDGHSMNRAFTSATLVTSKTGRHDGHAKARATKGLKKHFTKQPEYNKSLPDIPKLETFYQSSDDPWSTKNTSLDLPRRRYRADRSFPASGAKLNDTMQVKVKDKAESKPRFPFLSVFTRKNQA